MINESYAPRAQKVEASLWVAFLFSNEECCMKLKPTADRILVRRNNINMTSRGGIMLPDIDKKSRVRCFEATVLAVGSGTLVNGKRIPVEVEVGDVVLFGKFNGVEVDSTDEALVMLHEDDILAKISKNITANY